MDTGRLRALFGAATVRVTDTHARHEGLGPVRGMPLADYLDWWERPRPTPGEEALYVKGPRALAAPLLLARGLTDGEGGPQTGTLCWISQSMTATPAPSISATTG